MTKLIKAVLLLAIFVGPFTRSFAQTEEPLYKKTNAFPVINLLLPDSTYFTKGNLDKKSSVMVMLFNPQCEHCQHETEEIIKNIEKFEGVQILMATSMPFDSMMNFRQRYDLAKYKNIVVSTDPNFTLISFYSIHSLPSLAFYNRKKEFMSLHEGGLPLEKVLKELDK